MKVNGRWVAESGNKAGCGLTPAGVYVAGVMVRCVLDGVDSGA